MEFKKVKNVFLMSLLLLVLNCRINAAIFTFSDESKLEGKIKDAKNDRIIIETEFGDIERMRSDIFSMTDLSSEETKILENNPPPADSPAENSPKEMVHEQEKTAENSEQTVSPSQNSEENVSPLPLPLNIAPVEPVKNIALSSTLNALEENDSEEESNETDSLEQSAYNSLLLLKNKLSKNFESRQNALIQSFERERVLLEKNLRDLNQKYNQLKESSQEKDLQINTLTSQMEQYKEQELKSEDSIVVLKKQLQELEEKIIRADINRTEDIKNALTKNKELLDKEKRALTESYEGQIAELKKQLESSSQKALEVTRANSQLSEKLAASEKNLELSQSALNSKEKELETFKADIKKQFGEFSEKTSSDKSTIEKTLVSSAETIAHLREYNSKLNDENTALKEQCHSLKKDVEALKEDLDSLDKEKDQYKQEILNGLDKHRIFKKKTKKRQEKLLQSLVETAMVETEKETPPPPDKLSGSDQKETSSAEGQTFEPSRLELLNLLQEDMKELNSKLELSQKNLLKSEKEKSCIKEDLRNAEDQIRFILSEQKLAVEKAKQSEKEKMEMKKQLENLIKEIREEARQNIEKQKEEFKKQFDDSLKSFEAKNLEAALPDAPEPVDFSDFDIPASSGKNSPPTTASAEKKSMSPPVPLPAAAEPKTKIEIGVVAQIEADFKRVFIDTKEKVNKGDIVYVQTEYGEAPFKIIIVYDDKLMKGAIAEIKKKKLLKYIRLKDPAYIR